MTMRRCLFLLALLVGCGDRTGLIVEVTSDDLVVPLHVDALRFQATNAYGAMVDRRFTIRTDWPHSLTLVPPAGETVGTVVVTVTGYLGETEIASQTVEAQMAPGETRRVTVHLARLCGGATCMMGETCREDRCVSSDGGMPDGGTRDGGRVDGGPLDAGVELDGGRDVDGGREVDGGRPIDGGRDGGRPMDGGRDGGRDAGRDAGGGCAGATCVGLVVVSEFSTRGSGGASDEFVELYNRAAFDIDLSGGELTDHSSTGVGSRRLTLPAGTIIRSRGYLLMATDGFTGGVARDIPMGWASGFADDGGSVSIVLGGARLDLIGWGTATVTEGTAIAALSAGALTAGGSYERKATATSTTMSMAAGGADATAGNGYDTENNMMDVVTRVTRDPQSSASPREP